MESTGVYWISIFEYLESQGFQCCLISFRSIKRVPERKSDVEDGQWIQTLHSYGLLESSSRPEADLVALHTLLRHRAQLIQHRSPHIQHMQKALLQMIIQLSQALSDITGQTGQHWSIENGLHWFLDIAFNEDRSRVRKNHAPANLTGLRHMAVNFLKQETSAKGGIKAKRLQAGWNDDYLLKDLSGA